MSTAIVAHTVSDIERMAKAFAASKLFGVQNPEQAIALCLIAQAEGRHPASAAQDYHIISGRPSKKADAMLRDFIAGGGKVEWHALDDTQADATFSHHSGGSVRITWDMERAARAQLKTAMWTKYPRQMLRARVVSEGVRTVYPMATSGMYVPEEVQEFEPQQIRQDSSNVIDGEATMISDTISDEQLSTLGEILDEAQADKRKFCEYFRIASLSKLAAADYARAMQMAEAKLKQTQAKAVEQSEDDEGEQ